MAESVDEKKELYKLAGQIVLLMLFALGSVLFVGFDKTGNTFVDTWCWFTVSACCEFVLGKPLSSVVTGIKNRFAKKSGGG